MAQNQTGIQWGSISGDITVIVLDIIVIVFHLHLSNVRFNLTAKIAMSEGYSVRCNQKFHAKRGTGLKKYTTAGGEYQVWSYLTCSIFLSFLKKIPRCMARILYLVQECWLKMSSSFWIQILRPKYFLQCADKNAIVDFFSKLSSKTNVIAI